MSYKKPPSTEILDPRRPGYHDYWYDRGTRIAKKTVELLTTQSRLVYPNVFPATRTTLTIPTASLSTRRTVPLGYSDVEVNDDEPVVKGFIEGMKVGTFTDLKLSPVLREIGFLPVFDAVFRAEDYPEAVSQNLNVVYLPAVLVDYVPVNPSAVA